jgi:hypothetical protein
MSRERLTTSMENGVPDLPDPRTVEADDNAVGVYDPADGGPRYAIADLGAEGRWPSMPAEETRSLEEWR